MSARRPSASTTTRRPTRRVRLRARELAHLQCQNLELDILNLRQEIATLSNLRKLLYARTLNRPDDAHGFGRFEKVVREFYALTSSGYRDVVWRTTPASAEPIDVVQFIRSVFAETVAIGVSAPTDHGVDDFFKMIAQGTAMLDSPKGQLLQAHVTQRETHGLVKVYAKSRCTSSLTGALLDKVFPHVRDVAPSLRDKLIGRTLVTLREGQFTFDMESGRVIRVNLSGDYVAGIMNIPMLTEELKILKHEPRIIELPDHDECEVETSTTRNRKGKDVALSPMSLERVLSEENDDDTGHSEAIGA